MILFTKVVVGVKPSSWTRSTFKSEFVCESYGQQKLGYYFGEFIFKETSEMGVSIFGNFSLLSPDPLSHRGTVAGCFSGRFLGFPATSRYEIGSKIFISSSSTSLYKFYGSILLVGGEISGGKTLKIAISGHRCRRRFLPNWPAPLTGLCSPLPQELSATSPGPIRCRTAAYRRNEIPATASFRGKFDYF